MIPGLGRSPGGRHGNPIPVFLPREFYGEGTLAGYTPWGHKDSDMTEKLNTHTAQAAARGHGGRYSHHSIQWGSMNTSCDTDTDTDRLDLLKPIVCIRGFSGSSDGKESASSAGDPGSIPGSGREWQPTPVFLPGKSHGQRNLVGYSPWGHKELDMTE